MQTIWKFAEGKSNAAGEVPEGKAHDAKRLALVNEGLGEVEKCFEKGLPGTEGDLGQCYKWKAVLLSKWGDMQGTADKIKNSYHVRDNAQEACDRLPHDSVANHVLGAFFFHVSNLSWVEKKVASTLFATPPSHTFTEALPYLHKAQEAEPTYIRNALMLGDTYTNVGNREEARKWYTHCSVQQATTLIEEPLIAQCKAKAK
eukprot:TRINITY_DN5772_c2_g1_i1.p1 TRINITY_DN5772_c2_g1~~TRINITY_DN5772_c2_g1_i1.p1  ORF type:complete len:202 (+),score=50.68 TRINITY_DN5772_c2_g1_i1:47-652(+)